jgi:hypothetical protein
VRPRCLDSDAISASSALLVISASSHQRFYSVSPKSLYASYQPAPGPWRSHGTGRRPTPPPGEISESPIWAGHALRGLYNF